MKTNSLKFTLIVCIVITTIHTTFISIPLHIFDLYNFALRPAVYTVLTLAVYVFMGRDSRIIRKAYWANMIAVLAVVVLGIVLLATSFLFGAGINIMAENPRVVINSMWERGLILVLGDLMRYKLIKSSGKRNRIGIVVALTIVFAYAQMNALWLVVHGDVMISAVFFESVFRTLVISSVTSYFSIKGSFFSVIFVNFIYTMFPYLLPTLPHVSQLAMSLIVSGLVVGVAIIYSIFVNESRQTQRQQEKRAERYAQKSILNYAFTGLFMAVLVVFFAGIFPIYPKVILTGSMTGTFDRGSVVFIQRVREGEAYLLIGEGYPIHFINHGGVPIIHRVIGFSYDTHGERQYLTRGDASELADPFPVSQNEVLGIARASLPFVGYPRIFLQSVFSAFW